MNEAASQSSGSQGSPYRAQPNVQIKFRSYGIPTGESAKGYWRVHGALFLLSSVIPLCFLIYTLVKIEDLGITITHPRAIIEFGLFLGLFLIGLFPTV